MGISWTPALADGLAAGLPLQVLGQSARSGPLSRLLVLGRSDPDGGASLAAVLAGTMRTPAAIEKGFRTVRRGGAVFVLDEHRRERFVLSRGLLEQVVIS